MLASLSHALYLVDDNIRSLSHALYLVDDDIRLGHEESARCMFFTHIPFGTYLYLGQSIGILIIA